MALDGCVRSVETARRFLTNKLDRFGYEGILILSFDGALLADLADLFDCEYEYGRSVHAAETTRLIEELIGGDEVYEPDPNPSPQGRLRNRDALAASFCADLAKNYLFDEVVFVVPSRGEVRDILATYLEGCFQKGKESSGQSVLRALGREEVAI